MVEQARQVIRLINAFGYFLKFCQIEDKQNKCAIPFKLWPRQQAILHDITDDPRLIILKARQLGLTWLTAAYCLWLAMTRPLQLIVVISVNEDLSVEFLDRVYFILDRLPDWMLPPVKTRTRQTLEFSHLDGLISIIKSLPTTELGAQSKTPTLLVLDETARNRMVGEIYAASLPGIDAGGGRVIVISNSIKTGPGWSWTRDIFTASMRGENSFKRIFLSWQAHPGRPKDFKALKLLDGMSEQDFSEHYPETEEEAISALTGSYFGDVLGRHRSPVAGVMCNLTKGRDDWEFTADKRGIVEVWRYPYRMLSDYDNLPYTNRYAVGTDISEGLGASYSVAYVVDRLNDEVVARMRSNRVDAYKWADMVHDLSRAYDNALICPERTGAGQTTVKRLVELGANLYVRVKADKVTNRVTKVYGWEETNQAKHELCGDLRAWLGTMRGQLYCGTLIDECSTWIKHDSGRLGPEEGKLGDCVIAAGLARQADLFQEGKPEKAKQPEPGWWQRHQQAGRSAWTKP